MRMSIHALPFSSNTQLFIILGIVHQLSFLPTSRPLSIYEAVHPLLWIACRIFLLWNMPQFKDLFSTCFLVWDATAFCLQWEAILLTGCILERWRSMRLTLLSQCCHIIIVVYIKSALIIETAYFVSFNNIQRHAVYWPKCTHLQVYTVWLYNS